MFGLFNISFILVILFNNLNAQINLNKTNLANFCQCDPMRSTSINLSYRNIKTIDQATLTGLASFQYLYLNSNQISSIDPATFKGLTSLQELWLHTNRISFIHPSTFTGLTSLRYLYLKNICIKYNIMY